MKDKLQINHLQALSNVLLSLSELRCDMGTFTTAHALICAEVKVKVDRKIANGTLPAKGVKITLTPAQYYVLMVINQRNLFAGLVDFRNALFRLLNLNTS